MYFLRTLSLCLFLFLQSNGLFAQAKIYVYVTPSGTHYHTATCRMVDNTSKSILLSEALKLDMKPCSFCKPDENKNTVAPEAIQPVPKPGQKEVASQCLGLTQEGMRCKHVTKNANGYCFQHLPQGKA